LDWTDLSRSVKGFMNPESTTKVPTRAGPARSSSEHIPIPGTQTPRYLEDNAGAAATRLSDADLGELNALPASVGDRY
jgi:hypothetical protein